MMMNRINKILGTKYPIIQAPMTWVTSAELAAAVSNAGGMGTLGPNAGQSTATSDAVETAERMRREILKTRKLTDKPFGVNYILPFDGMDDNPFSKEILKVLVEEKVEIVVAVGNPNIKEIKKLKELGFTVIFRELTPTVAGAKAAEEAGADIIVATGFDEGGSTPSTPIGTMTIVPLIVDAVSVPVMATGGIVDKRGVNASFALGAEGVYLGTRFIASVESPASEAAKQEIIHHSLEDLVLLPTGYGGFWRSTPSKFALEAKKLIDEGVSSQELEKKSGNLKTAMVDGNLEEGVVTISSSIGLIKEIQTCEEIINELMADFKAAE